MTEEIRGRLYAWIDQAAIAQYRGEALTEIELCHLDSHDERQAIGRFMVDPLEESTVHEAKAQIWMAATNTQEAWRGFQRFFLGAFYGDPARRDLYFPFALSGDDTNPGRMTVPEGHEPANMTGVLKMQMRHNEVHAKVNAGMHAEQNAMLLRHISTLSTELERLRERHFELLARTEESMSQMHDRELARMSLERGEARRDQLAAKALEAFPVIANRVSEKLGGPRLMAERDPAVQMMCGLLQQLDDHKLQVLLSTFPNPAHQATILELYDSLVRQPAKLAAANRAKEASESGGDGNATH